QVIPLWQGWATAFPDAKATFDRALPSDTTVVLELTWNGTHKGPLQTPQGPIPATGKTIEIRSCFVTEIAGDKAKLQRHYFDMATMLQRRGVESARADRRSVAIASGPNCPCRVLCYCLPPE